MPARPRPLTIHFSELANPDNPTPVEEFISHNTLRRIPDRRRARGPGRAPADETVAERKDAIFHGFRLFKKGLVTELELAELWEVSESVVVEWIMQKRKDGEL